ncbi:MAG: epimerase, partial [Gemmatimonadetes bacterium 21-71-4]
DYLRRRLPLVPKGSAYCWAHVDDVARAHVLAMERARAGEQYFVCGPVHTVRDALRVAQEITGVPAPRFSAPPAMLKATAALMRVVETAVPVPANYRSEYLRVGAGVTYLGSNAKARRELGWEPRPLREGLAETLHYEMQQPGVKSA